MQDSLTRIEEQFLIAAHKQTNGRDAAFNWRQIGRELNLSESEAQTTLRSLKENGYCGYAAVRGLDLWSHMK